MKIFRYQDSGGSVGLAVLKEDGSAEKLEGELLGNLTPTRVLLEPGYKVLAPLEPWAILCIGLNYRHHAAESGAPVPEFPVLFMKPPGAVQNPGDPILLPSVLKSTEVDYECELAIIIGKECRNVRPEEALEYVLGYTCANDVSARDWQKTWGGSQWCRGKSFDTFCPLGPVVVTTDEIVDPNKLAIKTDLNGELVQDWNTNDMIFDVPSLISFLSSDTTLKPGTVILTGTPHGVGMARKPPLFLKDGDTVTIEIEGIGRLTNPVKLAG